MQIGAARNLLNRDTQGGDWSHGSGSSEPVAILSDGVFLSDGSTLSRIDRDGHVSWTAEVGACPSSPAASSEGNAYVVAQGHLKAFDPNGKPLWDAEVGEAGRPAIGLDDSVYVVAGGRLKAFDRQGLPRFDIRLKPLIEFTGGHRYSDPQITPQGLVVVASNRRWVKAFHPDGELAWTYKLPSELSAGPSVARDGSLALAMFPNTVVKLNPEGKELWSTSVGSEAVSMIPLIGLDGAVHAATTEGELARLDGQDGHVEQRRRLDADPVGRPDLGPDGSLYVSSYYGVLHRVDPATLATTWQSDLQIAIGGTSPQVAADGTVYVNRHRYGLLALREQRDEAAKAHERAELAARLAAAPEEEAPALGRTGDWLVVGGVRVPVKA
ncbi:MAG: PQQ-binding-like beta-propeller repeat protein [Candidatus Eremiobacterota bacterium]